MSCLVERAGTKKNCSTRICRSPVEIPGCVLYLCSYMVLIHIAFLFEGKFMAFVGDPGRCQVSCEHILACSGHTYSFSRTKKYSEVELTNRS
jgi:hypothetical protein